MQAHHARVMAIYNQWMNEKLYNTCGQLTDEERKKDRGAFFKSIHGTLNHILLGDKIWMSRFKHTVYTVTGLDQELFQDFNDLRNERTRMDDEILSWAAALSDEELAGDVEYTSIVNPERRRYLMWVAVTHFFNHQTHHRGQLTVLLSQCGMDYGVTDLIWLREVQPENLSSLVQ